jgi:hypothetical protein
MNESRNLSPNRRSLQFTASLDTLNEAFLEAAEELFERDYLPIGFITPLLELSKFKVLEFILSYQNKGQLTRQINGHVSDIQKFVSQISTLFPLMKFVVVLVNYRINIGFRDSTLNLFSQIRTTIDSGRHFYHQLLPAQSIKFEAGKAIFFYGAYMRANYHHPDTIKRMNNMFAAREDPSESPITFIHDSRWNDPSMTDLIPQWSLRLQ